MLIVFLNAKAFQTSPTELNTSWKKKYKICVHHLPNYFAAKKCLNCHSINGYWFYELAFFSKDKTSVEYCKLHLLIFSVCYVPSHTDLEKLSFIYLKEVGINRRRRINIFITFSHALLFLLIPLIELTCFLSNFLRHFCHIQKNSFPLLLGWSIIY